MDLVAHRMKKKSDFVLFYVICAIVIPSLVEVTGLETLLEIDGVSSTIEKKNDTIGVLVKERGICSMYLAPSSIPGAGYGVYTTKPYKMSDEFSEGALPAVVIVDTELNMYADAKWPFADYVWEAFGAGAYEARLSETWNPTPLGSLGNYHPYLQNYGYSGKLHKYEDSMTSRFVDPEAGAFSYHASIEMNPRRDIAAGEELFADYGEHYLETRSHDEEDIYRLIPRVSDYEQAALLSKALSKLDKIQEGNTEAIQTVIKLLTNERVASIFPRNLTDFPRFVNMTLEDIAFDLAWRTVNRRSVDWVVTNGKCLDGSVEIRKSSIPKAGMGAFATRRIKRGEMIVPAPLVHIPDRDSLNLYNRTIKGNKEKKAKRNFAKDPRTGRLVFQEDKPNGKQMLMNYCFGHKESSVLLCPATSAVAINHCSTRTNWKGQCNKDGANAGYQWPEDWSPETKEWLQLTFDELNERHGRGLVLEIRATRDIEIGDEIFLDYGEGWEIEWMRHVKSWSPPEENGNFASYASITDLNVRRGPALTSSELSDDPLPANVMAGCMYVAEHDNPYEKFEEGIDESTLSEDMLLNYFALDAVNVLSQETGEFIRHWPCDVIDGNDEDGYTVRIHQASWEKTTEWTEKGLPLFLKNFPRESIAYFNKQGFSDQFLPNSFRHHIELSDELFPDQWKNLANQGD